MKIHDDKTVLRALKRGESDEPQFVQYLLLVKSGFPQQSTA
jgi:hypothetical protein